MSDFLENSWFNHPNAPKITPWIYFAEKANFAGFIIGAVLYGTPNYSWAYLVLTPSARSIVPGIVIVLFLQCMGALLNPINRTRGGTKFGLMTYTVTMFSLATIITALQHYIQSVSYVDYRDFPGVSNPMGSGPAGYILSISTKAIQVVPTVIFTINFWLADGLLVSSVPNAAAHAIIVDCSSSSIVALSSIP